MSISVDESGIPAPRNNLTEAVASLRRAAASSGVPPAYKRALRTGTLGSRHRVTIAGQLITVILADGQRHPADPARERASWIELRDAFLNLRDGTGDNVTSALPAEVAAAVWRRNGREVRAYQPGAAPALRRTRQRIRRRLTALSPLPLLTALIQPLAGSATAVGIAVVPVLPVPAPPPAPAVATPSTGDITRPQPPYTLADLLNTPPTPTTPPLDLPPAEATAPDTTTPPPAVPLPTPSPSATPTPTISPTATASPGTIPSPTPTPEQTTTVPQPIRTILDTLTGTPTAEPSPTPQTSATSGPPRHGKHKGHRHRQGHGHGKHKGHWSRWLR